MPAPASYELLDYANTKAIDGSSQSTFHFKVAYADVAAAQAFFLRAYDADDLTLICSKVDWRHWNNDPQTGICDCRALFQPVWKVFRYSTTADLQVRYRHGSTSFTVKSSAWKWGDDKPILNNEICPLQTIGEDEVILFGTRANHDLATYDAYRNKVNSDTFLGAGPGFVLFIGAGANPRQLETGSTVYDLEIQLKRRTVEWNKFLRQTDGTFQYVKNAGGNLMFDNTAFAGLITS